MNIVYSNPFYFNKENLNILHIINKLKVIRKQTEVH
jgi:hypothetical protein